MTLKGRVGRYFMRGLTPWARLLPKAALGLTVAVLLLACGGADVPRFGEPVALGRVDDADIDEASGLAASRRHPAVLWTHNDGSDGVLFAVGENGRVIARYSMDREVEDCEDMAIAHRPGRDRDLLFVGDIGDNDSDRELIRILEVREPVPRVDRDLGEVSVRRFRYPEGARDAEALLYDSERRRLLVVTKEEEGAGVYRVPDRAADDEGIRELIPVARVPLGRVSGGAISPRRGDIIFRREEKAWLWEPHRGEPMAEALQRAPVPAPVVGPPAEPNGEAIAFHPEDRGYYTLSEEEHQPIFFFERLSNPNE